MRELCNIFVIAEVVCLLCYLFAVCWKSYRWTFIFSVGIVICSAVLIVLAILLEHGALWACELLLLLKYIAKMIDNYQTVT